MLKDISFRMAPVSRMDVEEKIHEIKSFGILRANSKPYLDAGIDIILRLSQLSLEFHGVVERVTIDSLLVFEEGLKPSTVQWS